MTRDAGGVGSPGFLTYRGAGVDIDEGMEAVEKIKPMVASTKRPEVLSGLGGFAGLFALGGRWKDPVLVSGTDGVGTKLRVAIDAGRHDTVGIDLVAMCVNDVAVTGAEVLFFLDYVALGKLRAHRLAEIVSGIAEGCRRAGCALLGGETAEMPGFYPDGDYDLSGFAVGAVERDEILDGRDVTKELDLVGVASTGIHSNGLSLARKALFDTLNLSLDDVPTEIGRPLGEELLEPTAIYARLLTSLAKDRLVAAASHITGGGLLDNPPRMLPAGLGAEFEIGSWPVPGIFRLIAKAGVSEEEMRRTFNMGLGLVLVARAGRTKEVIDRVGTFGFDAWKVGRVLALTGTDRVRFS